MQNTSNPPIMLASSSRYRRELLDRILSRYESESPDIDEAVAGDKTPAAHAARLARRKVEVVARRHPQHLVIGADQLAVLEQTTIGKPRDHSRAVDQLLQASGKSMQFLTAVCVLDPVTGRCYEHIDETTVRFRPFGRRLAEHYLRHDEPYDCAGSFKVEGAGFVLFQSVETTDPTALVGLPMIWLGGTLQELGYLLS